MSDGRCPVKQVPLSQGKHALVDDSDYVALSRHRWYFHNGYAIRNVTLDGRNTTVAMHREVMGLEAGDPRDVDHKNLAKADNRRCNLRVSDKHGNQHNQRARGGTSRFKGVSWREEVSRWQAHIGYCGVRLSLGLFDIEEDAACAYDAAAEWFFGEFARPNLDRRWTEKETS